MYIQALLHKRSVGAAVRSVHTVGKYSVPSTREVRRESSVAFLRPGGRERPMESSLCRNT